MSPQENEDVKKGQNQGDSGSDQSFSDKIDPTELPEELQGVYKSMQADYTRKTQSLAEERKSLDERFRTWEEQNADKFQNFGKLEKEVEQWRAWYASTQGQSQDHSQRGRDSHDSGLDLGETGDDSLSDSRVAQRMAQLEAEITAIKQQSSRSNEEVGRMLRYQDELNELKSADPEINKDEVIDFMLKEGIQDPRRAYKELYQDKIIEREAQKRFEEHVTKFEEKQKADMLTGPGSPNIQSSFYKPPKHGKPDSWDKALEEVELAHRKSELGMDPYGS